AILADAVETIRPVLEREGLELLTSVPVTPIHLDGDPVRLAQVFCNLLDNAAKYGKQSEGGGKIWLSAEQESGYASVSVKDRGMGIAPGMSTKIFDMFTQVGRSLRQSEGGLGIGLSLVKRLVELHGGGVEAFSEGIGKRSEFVVRIPFASRPRSETESTVRHSESIDHTKAKRRILIADDNRDVVESFEVMLQMLGYEVQTALDGLEALKKAEEFHPEVIVLDLGMPKLDGYETARRIRQQTWGREVVLVALTGWSNN